ncbi:VWA domain-containing protein [Plectonema cf. radiosum LEGE 06105]|uniref:VWA domain-containing protein n=1 Tax=Plectonema cf. radiosum LEGE 06105 TaxID=945769 RepID=A0A8J7EZV9_9CYAN|nr:VWA domain-containing protein [Plectonema radiosum]MBE9211830.1 VWA domain-containing protein [Plectonema cf. radiosum LEGE 06105]
MISKNRRFAVSVMTTFSILLLTACDGAENNSTNNLDNFNGLKIKLLVGSALDKFCAQAVQDFNATQPQLEDGTAFRVECEALGSGDVVSKMVTLATQLKNGTLPESSPDFPTIVSVDGEIYQNQLIYQVNQLFPGQNYIPQITESPLLANSPMVLMAQADIAPGLEKVDNFYQALATAKNHRDIDSSAPLLPINFVHTAPTRSNSGLQTLVTQFASVSGKRPETITVADVQKFESQVQQIQAKITRYGTSTGSLAKSMVKNGQFWASVGSVYESSVIDANSHLQPGQQSYQAVYPQATFTSNMRAILPKAPWVSADEKAAAEKFIDYLRSAQVQKIATELGLRPGVPGIPLGEKFSSQFGVNPQAKYDSLRPPQPEVVEAMLKSWQEVVKKPSLVVVVVDSSGSMEGEKLPAVQTTLQTYINSLGPKEQIALIDFDKDIRPPVLVDGTPEGKDKGIQFVNSLEAGGGTRLYDAAISARDWLTNNLRQDAINAVLILTDGDDTTSQISLEQLKPELQKSGFNSDQRIAFFTIGYGNEREFNPEALKIIAELNGGYYSKGNPETISKLMSDLQLEF